MDKIIIKGAKENNLKNISIELPRDKFIVFTGGAVQARLPSLLIQYMQKDKDVMLKVCPPMQEYFGTDG